MRPKLSQLIESLKSLKPDHAGGALAPLGRSEPTAMTSDRHEVSWNVDASPSMSEFLGPLFHGMKRFAEDLMRDAFLSERVDLTVWALDDYAPAKRLVNAVPANRFQAPRVPRCSHSPIYGSMKLVWQDAISRSEQLATRHHCDVASSWVFLFSDCCPTDDPLRGEALKAKAKAREAGVNTFVLTLGMVDEEVARELSDPGRRPVALESVEDFTEFFAFLKRSLRLKSMSMPGQPLRLEFKGQSLEADA